MSQKKILIVDDHHHIREMLTALLTNHSDAFSLKSVPSGEEAMLELRDIDLLISDVKLPGMNGIDLTKRLRRRKQETAVILITGYETEAHQQEAAKLNVYKLVQKPLDTEQFLQTVDYALYGEPENNKRSAPSSIGSTPKAPVTIDLSTQAINRLEGLRTDTGASGIMLTTAQGQLVYEGGHNERFELENIAKIAATSLATSLQLSQELNSKTQFTIQYNATDKLELYSSNIGERYFLTLFFAVQARRGRIGTIWIFLQRGISDLSDLLPKPSVGNSLAATASGSQAGVANAQPRPELESYRPDDSVLPTDEEFARELQQLENAIVEIERQSQLTEAKATPPAKKPKSRTRNKRKTTVSDDPQPQYSSKSAYEEAKERHEAKLRAKAAAAPPPPEIPDIPEYTGPTEDELKLDPIEVDLSGIDKGTHGDLLSLFDNLDDAGGGETGDFWNAAAESTTDSPPSLEDVIQQGLASNDELPDFSEADLEATPETPASMSYEEAMKNGLLNLGMTDGKSLPEATDDSMKETADLLDLEKLLDQELQAEELNELDISNGEAEGSPLSFEEALKRGLIPGLNQDEA